MTAAIRMLHEDMCRLSLVKLLKSLKTGSNVPFIVQSSTLIAMENVNFYVACEEDFEHLYKESARLATFNDWISPAVTPADLAQAGFYFRQYRDIVKCVFCKLEVLNWVEGDSAMGEHYSFNPWCRFLVSIPSAVQVETFQLTLLISSENWSIHWVETNVALAMNEV